MSADFFIDSNVAIYSLDKPSIKRDIARQLISKRPIISTQVVMETMNVLIRKFKFEKQNAIEAVMEMMDKANVKETSAATVTSAFEISLKYKISHWDALIIAAALQANCNTLYSEDMQHGLLIENKLTIISPFS